MYRASLYRAYAYPIPCMCAPCTCAPYMHACTTHASTVPGVHRNICVPCTCAPCTCVVVYRACVHRIAYMQITLVSTAHYTSKYCTLPSISQTHPLPLLSTRELCQRLIGSPLPPPHPPTHTPEGLPWAHDSQHYPPHTPTPPHPHTTHTHTHARPRACPGHTTHNIPSPPPHTCGPAQGQ